jgi:hypothetical protein
LLVCALRFGQRCGEIKVEVFANTEVGLSDQLKEVTTRVKTLERDLQLSEDERVALEAQLEDERMNRKRMCDPRTLTVEEKTACKACVQNLLTAAKASISLESAASPAPLVDGASPESEVVIERSQEELYDTVEGMDKAVLVELCTALGGLVQTMYIEREKMKKEELERQRRRDAAKAEQEAKAKAETAQEEVKAKPEMEKQPSPSNFGFGISQETSKVLIAGATFIKHSRIGSRDIRYVWLTPDLLNICWRQIGNMQSQNSMSLRDFDM